MAQPAEELSADDVWPVAKKLPRDQEVQLARRLLREAAGAPSDADAYGAMPARPDEFGSDEGALAWEGEGWEEFYAKGQGPRMEKSIDFPLAGCAWWP